ncbi:MAG TPA: cyclodeaminase/cyclohydrolase family protein [Gemmatimonadales bacterium]|nr:cyclodeaminase/cyclohydrolase family protein [Gemmatimonadales bacterium]
MPDSHSPTRSASLNDWARLIARPTIAPGGGSAAAAAGVLAAAVVEMVAGLTAARDTYAAVHDEARAARARAEGLRQELLTLASADAEALLRFEEALALPRGSDAQRQLRERRKRAALGEAAEIQRDVLACCAEVAGLGAAMVERGLRSAQADAATGVFLAAAAARSAAGAIATNLEGETADSEFATVARAAPEKLAEAEEAERAAGRLLASPPA